MIAVSDELEGSGTVAESRSPVAKRLRTLRAERGWSARQLAEACELEGAGSLTRSAIAKIEADLRRIADDEAAVLARILGVTSSSFLESTGKYVFLSHSEEDGEVAQQISEWLAQRGIEIYDWQDQSQRGGLFIRQIEQAISTADAFLVLLSPSFLASHWCRRERDLAMIRELELQSSGSARVFIHVLKVDDTPYADAGFLQSYDWLDLTHGQDRHEALADLLDQLQPSRKEIPGSLISAPRSTGFGQRSSEFQERSEEVDKLLRGLANVSGPHFWLLIAPPQVGKTWLLDRIADEATLSEDSRWAVTLVDVQEHPIEVRSDAAGLLARLFERTSPEMIASQSLLNIAQEVSRSGQPHLCLLDSAELLDPKTARTLRASMAQIYNLVQHAGKADVRLAFIVASRNGSGWRDVTPVPRLHTLSLSEFNVDVVQQSLRNLAHQMNREFSNSELRRIATFVHRLTEGLPAVLGRVLQWIREQEWLALERLECQEVFEELAGAYITETLLAPTSLFPVNPLHASLFHDSEQPSEWPRLVLAQVFRILAPYRLFTQTHLRYQIESDPEFERTLQDSGWSINDLWGAIQGTALLSRPLEQPWLEIQPAIRRLLFRYFYKSDEQRAEAHRRARKFVEGWAGSQFGREQAIGLVECLWHEAASLRVSEPAELDKALCEIAKNCSHRFEPTVVYSLAELRSYAAELLRGDAELRELLGNVTGLVDRLASIVEEPL
jgi:transcriptional regulator with XRE-family HTH domain